MTSDTAEIIGKALRQLAAAQERKQGMLRDGAVHLAYYAMFHAARAVLQQEKGTVSTKHGSVRTAFETLLKDEPTAVRQHAQALRKAYDARVVEDYTTTDTAPEAAAELVALAADFVAYCARRLGAEPPPTARP